MLTDTTTTLGALLDTHGGDIKTGPFGTKLKAAEYTPTGVPVISVGEVGYGRLRLHEKTPRVDTSVTNRMPEYLLRYGDIVFGRKGAVDRSARVQRDQDGWFLGSDGIRVRLPSNCDSAFIAYQLQVPAHRDWMLQHAAGSTMPSLNEGIIRRIPILLPSLEEQRAIAAVLGSLDDKIEQNRRTGSKLEGLARGVFKAWFVDFEPVKAKAAGATAFPGMPPETFAALPTRFTNSDLGPVPQGWEVRSLYSAATFINGAAFKSSHFCDASSGIPVVKIAELKAGITGQTKHSSRTDLDSRYRIDTGEILYSWSGSPDTSLDTFIWTKGPGLLNQHIFRVVTESESQKVFVYYLLKHLKQDLIEIARNKQTTGLGHVTVGDMQRLLLAWPDPKTLNGFREVIGPVFAAAFNGLLESETLAALRDYLLPRLLTGRVRVGEAVDKIGRGA